MKNPFMSAWLSWANQATTAWTTAMMAATKRNQAAALKAATGPQRPAKKRKVKALKR